MAYMAPEAIPELAKAMLQSGYSQTDVFGVLGGNFFRVAKASW
jgi:microsomal dipeptidase-like Zn-dependent dipeptidase